MPLGSYEGGEFLCRSLAPDRHALRWREVSGKVGCMFSYHQRVRARVRGSGRTCCNVTYELVIARYRSWPAVRRKPRVNSSFELGEIQRVPDPVPGMPGSCSLEQPGCRILAALPGRPAARQK